jgi:hypothetical protein
MAAPHWGSVRSVVAALTAERPACRRFIPPDGRHSRVILDLGSADGGSLVPIRDDCNLSAALRVEESRVT